MRLTNAHREDFIDSIMAKVPKVAHEDIIRDFLTREALKLVPPAVLKMYRGPFSAWVHCTTLNSKDRMRRANGTTTYMKVSAWVPSPDKDRGFEPITKAAEPLVDAWMEHLDKLDAMRQRISEIAYGMTKSEDLAIALPDFAKYIPKEEKRERLLPVAMTGIIDEFKQAGWPA